MQKTIFMLLSLVLLFFTACKKKLTVPTNLKQYADNLLAKAYLKELPGAVLAIAKGDEIIYSSAVGMANCELGVPLSTGQVFRIGSVSKQFTASAILALVDDESIRLDDPLSKFFPDYPNGKNITILQLLNHTSGIKSYTGIKGIMSGPIRMDLSTADLISIFKDLPVDFLPGSDYSYNNSGYVLLGAIIETVTGDSWHEHLQKKIFTPYEFKKTEYGANERLIRTMVNGYTLIKGDEGKNLAPAGYLSMTQAHAAGALVSNPEDLLHWNRLLHTGKILKAQTYQKMINPKGKAKSANYGFGIERKKFRGQTILEHGGGIHGFSSYLLYLPESEIGVAIIQNIDVSPFLEIKHSELALRVAAFLLGKPFPEPIPVKSDESTLRTYQGIYKINKQENRELRLINGILTSKRTGSTPVPLIHIGEDRFLFPNGLDLLEIIRDKNNHIKGVQFTSSSDNGGQFAKLITKELPEAGKNLSLEEKKRLVGQYRGVPGLLRIRLTPDGRITAQLGNQHALEILPQTANLFFLIETGATLDFAPGKIATTVTLKQGGRTTVLNRVSE